MAGYILRGEEKSVVLKGSDVEKLLKSGNGDAALLYLALMRTDGGISARELAEKLHLSELRLNGAENALRELGLLAGETKPVHSVNSERTAYAAEELAEMLEDREYALLRQSVAEKLGKHLSLNDDQILAGLYHDVGFPADVIYLLVSHCVERAERRYGAMRRPTMRQIEKEGYYWQSLGICDQESAARYLKDYARKIEGVGAYMRILQLGDRPPVESEQRYILDWMEKGFTPETVALAYDRTVLRKQTLDWRYLNGILRRWHEAGWHTASDVEQGEKKKPASAKPAARSDNSWMRSYTKR